MEQISISEFKTPFGELILGDFQGELCLCDWKYRKMRTQIDSRITSKLQAEFLEEETDLIQETKKQLNAYFNKDLIDFDLPLFLIGTDFQYSVWKALLEIPYGKTYSYLDLSKNLNNVKAIRAVASANGANAISIIVPCHRIIGSSGELIGYAGGLSAKQKLLSLENSDLNNQLNLFE